ncbi:MAG: hypothetical protein J0I09_01645 [Sphingobacteriia bacterium]|nr:hypothetical protein [Sphingobacteriia bacterium]
MSEKNHIEDILLNQSLLKEYVKGNLSKEEQHAVEASMSDSAFLTDAVEGLQDFKDTKNIDAYTEQLNAQLKKQIQSGKNRRLKRKIKYLSNIEVTVITVIVLCLLGYFVIKLLNSTH